MTTNPIVVCTVCYCNVDTVAAAEAPISILDLVDLWWDVGVVVCMGCRLAYSPADATATHYLLLQ